VSKPEQAEQLRGYTVAVPLANLVELPAGEYYIFQLIGLEVHTTLGGYLGKLVNVESNPANDLYVVRGPISKKDILIPAIKDVVKNIDLEAGRITIELIEGLLDL
jgi:16S rRNA processing protein RimM